MTLELFKAYNIPHVVDSYINELAQEKIPKNVLAEIQKIGIHHKYIYHNTTIFTTYLLLDKRNIDYMMNLEKRKMIIEKCPFEKYIEIDKKYFLSLNNMSDALIERFYNTLLELNITKIINPYWLFWLYEKNIYFDISSIFTNVNMGGSCQYDNYSTHNGTLSVCFNHHSICMNMSNIYLHNYIN